MKCHKLLWPSILMYNQMYGAPYAYAGVHSSNAGLLSVNHQTLIALNDTLLLHHTIYIVLRNWWATLKIIFELNFCDARSWLDLTIFQCLSRSQYTELQAASSYFEYLFTQNSYEYSPKCSLILQTFRQDLLCDRLEIDVVALVVTFPFGKILQPAWRNNFPASNTHENFPHSTKYFLCDFPSDFKTSTANSNLHTSPEGLASQGNKQSFGIT